MSKKEEFQRAADEFDRWFRAEIEGLDRSTPPDEPASKNRNFQLFHDLMAFKKKWPQFNGWNEWDNGAFVYIHHCLNYGCYVQCFRKKKDPAFNNRAKMEIYTKSRYFYPGMKINVQNRLNFIYRYLDFLEQHSDKFARLEEMKKAVEDEKINEKIKQEKIEDIAKNSINTWLKAVLQNQSYSYYTTESENKITLSVKLKNRMQLDIPIYFSRFQKIMPELLNTIQKFEKTANEAKIKVLISNSKVNQQWKTQ